MCRNDMSKRNEDPSRNTFLMDIFDERLNPMYPDDLFHMYALNSEKLSSERQLYVYITSCDTRALHGLPILFIQPAFSKPLFGSVVPCNRGTCVHMCYSSFAFLLVLKFTPFSFSFSHSMHDLTQGENSDRLWRIFRVGHSRT